MLTQGNKPNATVATSFKDRSTRRDRRERKQNGNLNHQMEFVLLGILLPLLILIGIVGEPAQSQ